MQVTGKGETETPESLFRRVAQTAARAEHSFPDGQSAVSEEKFYGIMARLEFLPNSPALINAGKEKAQLAACFVLPVRDSLSSIFSTLKHAAIIHKSGGGTGFSFSGIRPRGMEISSTAGVSAGPLPFITVYNEATEAIKQGGVRRGANMAVLAVHHPDIFEFISAKSSPGALNNFNLSVAVTDEFMEKTANNDCLFLRFGNKNFGRVEARKIFDHLIHHAWLNGEPGILFIDRINEANPTPGLGAIEATNPCGEQPLLPYESCVLGSVNLARMVDGAAINWERLADTVYWAVRFLDDVLEINSYPLKKIDRVSRRTRKIGLGVMGWADMLFQLRIPYDSQQALTLAERVASFIQAKAHAASESLAAARGVFPAFEDSRVERPRRNATCTTIAPTGSISLIADCSAGIEPVFSLSYSKLILDGKTVLVGNRYLQQYLEENLVAGRQQVLAEVDAAGTLAHTSAPQSVKRIFVTALDIRPAWHVRMQAAFQRYCDNAVSKTVNLPEATDEKALADLVLLAYRLKCKGLTVYRVGSRPDQVQFQAVTEFVTTKED